MKLYQLVDERGKYYSLYKIYGQWHHKVTRKRKDAVAYTEKEMEFANDCYYEHGIVLNVINFKPEPIAKRDPKKVYKNLGRPKKQSI